MNYLKVKDLKKYTWYLGSGRGSDVGFWDGEKFHIFRQKYNAADHTTCSHWDDDGPFLPIEEIVSPWKGLTRSGHATLDEVLEKLNPKVCQRCEGTGKIELQEFYGKNTYDCDSCKGTGKRERDTAS